MAEEASERSEGGSRAPPGLGECLLSETSPECRVGALQIEREGGGLLSCQLIGIAQMDGGYLVAVPRGAWHRTSARRYLPSSALNRPVLAEVLAASEVDRRQPHPVWKVKTWIGILNQELVESVIFASGGEATAFGDADEGAEIIFAVAGSGGSVAGPSPACPLAASLTAIAGEHFSFHSAQEYAEGEEELGVPDRLAAVESAISELWSGRSRETRMPRRTRKAKAGVGSRAGPAVEAGLPGLDPAVVKSARLAGIPEAQLEKMSKLVGGARKLPVEPRGGGLDPLDDEEEEDGAEARPGKGGGSELETGGSADESHPPAHAQGQEAREPRGCLGPGGCWLRSERGLVEWGAVHERRLHSVPERTGARPASLHLPCVGGTSQLASELSRADSPSLDPGWYGGCHQRWRCGTGESYRAFGAGQPGSGRRGRRVVVARFRNQPRSESPFRGLRETKDIGSVRSSTDSSAGCPMGEHPHGEDPRKGRIPCSEAVFGRRRRSRPAWRRGSKRGPRQPVDRRSARSKGDKKGEKGGRGDKGNKPK